MFWSLLYYYCQDVSNNGSDTKSFQILQYCLNNNKNVSWFLFLIEKKKKKAPCAPDFAGKEFDLKGKERSNVESMYFCFTYVYGNLFHPVSSVAVHVFSCGI